MTKIRTHYDNLKVARNAPDIVIKAAHKALLQQHHPDKAKDKEAAERITRILNEARETLLDPAKRKQHDLWIKEQEHQHKHHGHHQESPAHHTEKPTPQSPPPQEPAITEELIGNFKAVSNGIAHDLQSQMTWCRFVLGQRWQDNKIEGEARLYSWQAAQEAAKAFNQQGGHAGYTDWRLPTANELKTLLNPNEAGSGFINSRVFPKNPRWLWSSSPYAGYGGGAWLVNFIEGLAINDDPHMPCAVRLVRG
jgi:curved DNA-binding protein CbpA